MIRAALRPHGVAAAACIVSSDNQVLAIKHFRGCQTVTPEAYLQAARSQRP